MLHRSVALLMFAVVGCVESAPQGADGGSMDDAGVGGAGAVQLTGDGVIVGFSADGSTLVWIRHDNVVCATRVATNETVEIASAPGYVTSADVDISADGSVVVFGVASYTSPRLFVGYVDGVTPARDLGPYARPLGPRRSFELSSDGTTLIFPTESTDTIALHRQDVSSGSDVVIGTTARSDFRTPTLSPSQRQLLYPTALLVYDFDTGRTSTVDAIPSVEAQFAADDSVIFGVRSGMHVDAVLWTPSSGATTQPIRGANRIELLADGFALAAYPDESGGDRTLYNVRTGASRVVGQYFCRVEISPGSRVAMVTDPVYGTSAILLDTFERIPLPADVVWISSSGPVGMVFTRTTSGQYAGQWLSYAPLSLHDSIVDAQRIHWWGDGHVAFGTNDDALYVVDPGGTRVRATLPGGYPLVWSDRLFTVAGSGSESSIYTVDGTGAARRLFHGDGLPVEATATHLVIEAVARGEEVTPPGPLGPRAEIWLVPVD